MGSEGGGARTTTRSVETRARARTVGGDDDGDDEAVDAEDTGHDHGDDGLHDELGAHDAHGGDADAGLGGAVGGAHAREDERGHGAHEAEEGGHLITVGRLRARRARGDESQEERSLSVELHVCGTRRTRGRVRL